MTLGKNILKFYQDFFLNNLRLNKQKFIVKIPEKNKILVVLSMKMSCIKIFEA